MQKIFNSERELIKKYGKEQAAKIKMRMGVLKSAGNLSQVPVQPPDRCHGLSGKLEGYYAVDLKNPFRLIFRPVCDELPVKEDGSTDLSKITEIQICSVEDYH
ncbi:MAG: type II toxin-antitoxin system RelE/ParE family toxin [Bacteroidota bacterium]